MTITELLAIIGDQNITLQYLDEGEVDWNWTKKEGCRCTFFTDPRNMPFPTGEKGLRLGVVLWLPRDLLPKEIFKR